MFVFACGMVRSGSTVQYQLTRALVEDAKRGRGLGLLDFGQLPGLVNQYASSNEMLVLKVHDPMPPMDQLFANGAALGLYIYRDIRDVVASYAAFTGGTVDSQIEHLLPSILKAHDFFTTQPGVLVTRYEDMALDTEVQRIAKHLGLKLTKKQAGELAKNYDLKAQARRIAAYNFDVDGLKLRHNTIHHTELLHAKHITGTSWRAALTSEQVARIHAMAGEWLEAHGYQL